MNRKYRLNTRSLILNLDCGCSNPFSILYCKPNTMWFIWPCIACLDELQHTQIEYRWIQSVDWLIFAILDIISQTILRCIYELSSVITKAINLPQPIFQPHRPTTINRQNNIWRFKQHSTGVGHTDGYMIYPIHYQQYIIASIKQHMCLISYLPRKSKTIRYV